MVPSIYFLNFGWLFLEHRLDSLEINTESLAHSRANNRLVQKRPRQAKVTDMAQGRSMLLIPKQYLNTQIRNEARTIGTIVQTRPCRSQEFEVWGELLAQSKIYYRIALTE
jgi:hypothetical protein